MNYDQMREVEQVLHGSFWKWFEKEITFQADSARASGSLLIPESMAHEYEREHLLAKANAYAELLTLIPSRIKEQLKELEVKENP